MSEINEIQQAMITLRKWTNGPLCPEWGEMPANSALQILEYIFQTRERFWEYQKDYFNNLEAQIKKMQCCGNCEHYGISCGATGQLLDRDGNLKLDDSDICDDWKFNNRLANKN